MSMESCSVLVTVLVAISGVDGWTQSRMFRRSVVGSDLNFTQSLLGRIPLTQCAAICGSKDNCLAFNHATFPNKTHSCQLSSTKIKTTIPLVSISNVQYYEEDCTRFIPPNYCMYGGAVQFANNKPCKLDNCTCLPRHRGDRCQQNCTFRADPGKDIPDLDIYLYIEPAVDRCLDNCSMVTNCLSVMYNGPEKRCILKTQSYYTVTKFSTTSTTNVLYSIKCV